MTSLPRKRTLHEEFQGFRPNHPDAMLNWDDNFIDLRECSSEFQQAFMYAWKVWLFIVRSVYCWASYL